MGNLISGSSSPALCVLLGIKSTPVIYGTTSLNYHIMGKTSVVWPFCQSRPHPHPQPLPPHQHQYHRQQMWAPWHQEYAANSAQVHSHSINWFEGANESSGCCQNAWSITSKFCKNNKVRKPTCFLHLAKSKTSSQQRWNQSFSNNNWESNHKVITSFVHCRQIYFYLFLINFFTFLFTFYLHFNFFYIFTFFLHFYIYNTLLFFTFFTFFLHYIFLHFTWNVKVLSYSWGRQTNTEEYTKETKQSTDCLVMKKYCFPPFFIVLLHIFYTVFSFLKQILRKRYSKIQTFLLWDLFLGENRSGQLEHWNGEWRGRLQNT